MRVLLVLVHVLTVHMRRFEHFESLATPRWKMDSPRHLDAHLSCTLPYVIRCIDDPLWVPRAQTDGGKTGT